MTDDKWKALTEELKREPLTDDEIGRLSNDARCNGHHNETLELFELEIWRQREEIWTLKANVKRLVEIGTKACDQADALADMVEKLQEQLKQTS